jgi:hypothetical protein
MISSSLLPLFKILRQLQTVRSPFVVDSALIIGLAQTINLVQTVIPPARVPHALEDGSRMAVDEVDVAADGFFEKSKRATP